MRDKGCFVADEEPTMLQLYNKISHLKKVLNLTKSVETTHQLRQKLANHMEIPDNDIEAYCAYANIQDDVHKEDETRVCVIFTTKLLSFLSKSDTIHVDATYRLNWQRFPVMIVGVSSAVGKFYGSFTVLSSHEDTQAWNEIFSFVHSENIHPKFRKSDGALSITNAGNEVFGSCEPSSNTNQSQSSFKDLAKERLKSRFDVSNISSFDKFMKIRKSCHLIEHVNDEFYCDCAGGSIARKCKHSAGLMFKMKILQIDSDVRSKPLGQKRKRG